MRPNSNSRSAVRVPIDTLRPPERAVLHYPKKQVEKAQKFLAAYDVVPVIYAAPDGEIIFWEEIWLALKANGAAEVDAVIIHDKSPAELAAIRLALHRIPLDAKRPTCSGGTGQGRFRLGLDRLRSA